MIDTKITHCPCGNDKQYINCCGRYLDNTEAAATAEILMRSRYTAYALDREDYCWQPGITVRAQFYLD